MSGIVWHILAFGSIAIFLSVTIYRTLTIAKLPIHLRWELAPIPHEKEKVKYGGSHLEEYEWWNKPKKKSRAAPIIIYMAKEIFLMSSVWEHNRALWHLTYSFHMGIYLVTAICFLSVINAVLMLAGIPVLLNISLTVASILALVGYLLGSLGAMGLILKRTFDRNLRPFNTRSKYFNLVFLATVFITGAYAWLHSETFASQMSSFIKGLITIDAGITAAFPLSLHIVVLLLFLIYLPLTDMVHFVAKYFAYHKVRWDNRPQDKKMEKELLDLLAQPVGWSAAHVRANGEKNWLDITTEEMNGEKKSQVN